MDARGGAGRGLPEAGTLQRELLDFRATITAAGNVTYGAAADWREGAHDDLVLATALALWAVERVPRIDWDAY